MRTPDEAQVVERSKRMTLDHLVVDGSGSCSSCSTRQGLHRPPPQAARATHAVKAASGRSSPPPSRSTGPWATSAWLAPTTDEEEVEANVLPREL